MPWLFLFREMVEKFFIRNQIGHEPGKTTGYDSDKYYNDFYRVHSVLQVFRKSVCVIPFTIRFMAARTG